MPLPPLSAIPPDVVSLDDYESLARERMTPEAWAYLSGGAADEITLRENREAFEKIRILPRLLRDMKGAHTRIEIFGQRFAHPILVAPTAFHRLFHPDGEAATVMGAAAMETGVVVSTSATIELEELVRDAPTPPWFQLYIQPDREFTLALVRRVEAAGYGALVVTVDAPLNGLRNRERRAGFELPPGIDAVNLRGMRSLPPADRVFGSELLDHAPTWKDLAWLRSHTRLPVVLKGVMHPDDVAPALDAGVAGLVVSNHGGRTLDTAPAAILALPAVVAVTAGRVPVLMDGGIRRGSDVFKALAAGADAVMVGRPVLHGLAAAGAVGVAHVLKILRAEFEMTMALAGCRGLDEIRAVTSPPTGGGDCDTPR